MKNILALPAAMAVAASCASAPIKPTDLEIATQREQIRAELIKAALTGLGTDHAGLQQNGAFVVCEYEEDKKYADAVQYRNSRRAIDAYEDYHIFYECFGFRFEDGLHPYTDCPFLKVGGILEGTKDVKLSSECKKDLRRNKSCTFPVPDNIHTEEYTAWGDDGTFVTCSEAIALDEDGARIRWIPDEIIP